MGRECKYQNKEYRTFDPMITLSPVVAIGSAFVRIEHYCTLPICLATN